jgi:DNA-binding SARP family transcriptional activator/tetratricopeptide (TPR) repeat protein
VSRKEAQLAKDTGRGGNKSWDLCLFGRPRLVSPAGDILPIPEKTFALAAYLLLAQSRTPVSRASLRAFLWETAEPKTAAANLRKLLARIRDQQQRFSFELIRTERDRVSLCTETLNIDLVRLMRLVDEPISSDLVELCSLYSGDLLEGVLGGQDFSGWMEVQRTTMRDLFARTVAHHLDPIAAGSNPLPLRIAARRLIDVDPYNEVGHRALMALHGEENETARIRDVYHSLERRLGNDLGIAPSAATRHLYERLVPTSFAESTEMAEAPASPATLGGAPAAPRGTRPEADETRDELATQSSPTPAGGPRLTVLPPPDGRTFHHQLAVSLIEDITIGLCRFRALSVIAPHTAWQLSNREKHLLLQSLGIDYVVETRLQNRGGEHWLAVRLINAVTREILWTDQYLFVQAQTPGEYRELSLRIILSLVERVERAELAHYDRVQDATAYRLFLTGQRYLRTLDLPRVRRARRAFKSALAACEDFVPALSGLARTYQLEWLLLARGDQEILREAERLAHLSIDIDPDDARGYRELGICAAYSGRFDESLQALAQGESCLPRYADLLNDYAEALVHACEPAEALAKITQAIELNPLCPDQYWWAAGGANYQLQRYEDAIRCLSRMKDQTAVFRLLAASHAMLGERDQARDYVRRARDENPDFEVTSFLSTVPFRKPETVQAYEHGLREAGFN